jgi:hypothetical protein
MAIHEEEAIADTAGLNDELADLQTPQLQVD